MYFHILFFFISIHTEMSAGDITRLSRMYHCPNSKASITLNVPTTKELQLKQQPSAQFPYGDAIKQVELNKTKDTSSTDDLMLAGAKNDILVNDDSDDMVLSKDQIDALYSLNAAKRNGLKSSFHHWPLGVVAFEIDPTFSKDFTAFHIFPFPQRFCFYSRTPRVCTWVAVSMGTFCLSMLLFPKIEYQLLRGKIS
jgi:hypothetical protein